MKEARESDRERILRYLKRDVKDCVYLYIDITNYGISSAHMKVWYTEENGELSLVAMKYYDSYQIYSHKTDCGLDGLCGLLRENPAAMVSGRKDLIERLERELEGYTATYGIVFCFYTNPSGRSQESEFQIIRATQEDTMDIARLMCSDDNFAAHYTVEGLSGQLADRIHTKTGRSYIARNDKGELIAHIATFAETEDVAVVSGAVVLPEYRKTDVFVQLDSYMGYHMWQEHKRLYAFANSKKMIKLQKMYGTVCGEYGKLERSIFK